MAVVAAGLVQRGHGVSQFDFLQSGAEEEALRLRIASDRPDVVALSLRNLDTCDSLHTQDYAAVARRLVAVIRTCTDRPVVLGGPAFTLMPEEMLAYTGADHGVVGEGEVLLPDLVDALMAARTSGAPVAPIWRSHALLGSAEISGPLFDPDLVAFYQAQSGILNLQTRRGCPHHCVYCNYPFLEGRTYRNRDPREVVNDLQEAQARYGITRFFFADSVFNDRDGHHLAIVEEILRRDLKVDWTCYMRPQGIRSGDLALMKRSGLKAAEFGTDAACDRTLRAQGKGFTFQDVLETNELFVAQEVPGAHFVMFGGPKETEDTVRESLENLARLRHTVVFAFTGVRIFPGTPLRILAIREGLISADDPLRPPVYYHAPGLAPERLFELLEAGFSGRRDRFFPPERGRERLEVLQRMGFRGQLWDSLVRFPKASIPALESPCC